MTHRGLAAATGLILRLPAWVISAFQSAQPGPGPDSSDRLNCRPTTHTVTVLSNTTLGATRASGLSAPVSVLVSFATVQQGSCWIAMPVVAASRCGLNVDDRPKADLESGLGASPRGFESRILRQLENRL